MSVSTEVQEFIYTSLAENNKSLLDQISKLIADSAESIKRSSVEVADDQLREIKKLRREEPKSFKCEGNEIQYKFNLKLQDTLDEVKSHLESSAVDKAKSSLSEGTSMLSERQKLILLADKSDFGWKTVEQYTQYELADNEEDGKKIRRAEERAEKALKSDASKKPINQSSSLSRPSSSSRVSSQYSRSSSSFGSFRNQRLRLSYPRSSDVPSRPGNCLACGRFGHWRSECNQVARSVSKGISGNRLQDGDKQSKSEFSFLTSPCDFVEDLSEDSSQESKGFELEFEIPVVSAPVVQTISVKSKLFRSIQHWQSLGAPDFILSVIRNGYKIPFISTPPPRRFTNNASALKEAKQILLMQLSWNSCMTIVSRK